MRYFQDTNGMWVGFIEEIPGVNSQGETLQELKKNLLEAVQMIIKANRDLSKEDMEIGKFSEETFRLALS